MIDGKRPAKISISTELIKNELIKRMHIVIFGGGIIGTFTAYIALQQGYKVTLIEKNNLPASGATNQNGGQLSFSHILSISNIKLLNAILKNFYTKNSPINIDLLTALTHYRWCLNFMKNSIKSNIEYNSLFSLSNLSNQLFKDLIQNNQNIFKLKKTGTIQLFRNKKSFYNTINQKELFDEFNITHHIISQEDIKSFCPTITDRDLIYKGIYFPNDMCGDSKKFTLSLFAELQKNKNFTFLNNQKITNFTIKNKRISTCLTEKNQIAGDHFILTPGAYIQDFCNQLKLNIPVMPLKGYSFNHPNLKIKTSLIDHDHKIVYSPLNQHTRIAGLYDFVGYANKIDNNRIKYLLKNVNSLFPNNSNNIIDIWTGMRPMSMDRFPIIGPSTIYKNLHYNIAHGNLGWTLSAGSAKITMDHISKSNNLDFNNIFLPQRFKNL